MQTKLILLYYLKKYPDANSKIKKIYKFLGYFFGIFHHHCLDFFDNLENPKDQILLQVKSILPGNIKIDTNN